jgi:hypothetical protein
LVSAGGWAMSIGRIHNELSLVAKKYKEFRATGEVMI